jgi:hypothetical protein
MRVARADQSGPEERVSLTTLLPGLADYIQLRPAQSLCLRLPPERIAGQTFLQQAMVSLLMDDTPADTFCFRCESSIEQKAAHAEFGRISFTSWHQ